MQKLPGSVLSRTRKLFLLATAVMLLAACKVELPPIESGFTAETWVPVEGPFKSELTPDQLKAIATWFAANRTGWKYKVTDNAPGPSVLLKHCGGKVTQVYLVERELWVGNRFKALSPEEFADVQALLAPKNPLPVFRR